METKGTGSDGHFFLDVAYAEHSNNRVLVVLPGVVGDSSDHYVTDLVYEANKRGYTAVVVNHTVMKKETGTDMKLLDVCSQSTVKQILGQLREKFGSDMFAVGFSLGGNHFLRGIGDCENG